MAVVASLECCQPKPVMNCPWEHFLGPQLLQLFAVKLLLWTLVSCFAAAAE